MSLLRNLVWLALFGAVYQELRKPPAERTWNGKVLGIIPYDFRIPDWRRLRDAYWDPSTDRVFSEHVFGVGWAVNIPVAIRRINAGATQYLDASARRASEEPIPPPLASGERPGS